jgi:hypothetical protein
MDGLDFHYLVTMLDGHVALAGGFADSSTHA